METWQIILLGIIQGITEFLPVSSSGHLILAPKIFGFTDQGLVLDVVLHLATLLVIIIFFKTELTDLFKSLIKKNDSSGFKKVAWSIIIASFPAGLLGLTFNETIEAEFRSPTFVAGNLLFWSFIFYFLDRKGSRFTNPINKIENIRVGQSLLIGLAQGLALLPGTSRSGITIAVGLVLGLEKETAARFSFLLGTPIILAAGIYELTKLAVHSNPIFYTPSQLLIGFITAFIFGNIAIKLLLKIVSQIGLLPFIIYRIVLATLIFLYFI